MKMRLIKSIPASGSRRDAGRFEAIRIQVPFAEYIHRVRGKNQMNFYFLFANRAWLQIR